MKAQSETAHYDLTIPGWMTPQELEWLYQQATRMHSIIEIGCWKGRSTVALMRGCRGTVRCVDPWPDHFSPLGTGETGILLQFIRNVRLATGRLPIMYPSESQHAIESIHRPVDMVFVDGNHDAEAVQADIELYRFITKKLLCGHDYGNRDYPGVKQAVDATVERYGWTVQRPTGLIWAVELQ